MESLTTGLSSLFNGGDKLANMSLGLAQFYLSHHAGGYWEHVQDDHTQGFPILRALAYTTSLGFTWDLPNTDLNPADAPLLKRVILAPLTYADPDQNDPIPSKQDLQQFSFMRPLWTQGILQLNQVSTNDGLHLLRLRELRQRFPDCTFSGSVAHCLRRLWKCKDHNED